MTAGAVHIVGAGLSGLAAAVRLAADGRRVWVHEMAGKAGGRCRSFHDDRLDRIIDNGNHLLLSGNHATLRYLDRIGARGRMTEIRPAAFPFLDLRSAARWMLRPNGGPLPWWLLVPSRRTAGARARDHLSALRLLRAPAGATVAETLGSDDRLYERLWKPLAVSVLNIDPAEGSARLMAEVLRRTLLRGEAACRPLLPACSLSDALVDPALAFLAGRGARLSFNSRLQGMETAGGRVTRLVLSDGPVDLASGDSVILALPPERASALVPGLEAPTGATGIVNAHFRLNRPCLLPKGMPFLGLVGGTAEWLFLRGDVLSATVSAADRLMDLPAEEIAARIWDDAVRATGAEGSIPPYRIIKEKRATFRQTPVEAARRPGPRTRLANLLLAGDWTDTRLPATIEGAVVSGDTAAAFILACRSERQ